MNFLTKHIWLLFCALLFLVPRKAQAVVRPLVETTYCEGQGEAEGKRYRYCHFLRVELLREEDGSLTFTYRYRDDQGRALDKEFGRIRLHPAELESFATICYHAWELFYNEKGPDMPNTYQMTARFRNQFVMLNWLHRDKSLHFWLPATSDNTEYLSIPQEGICATLVLQAQE